MEKRRSYSEKHAQNQPAVAHRHRTQVMSLRNGATTERKIIQLPARLKHEPLANTRTCCGDTVTSSYGNMLRELGLLAEGHRH